MSSDAASLRVYFVEVPGCMTKDCPQIYSMLNMSFSDAPCVYISLRYPSV